MNYDDWKADIHNTAGSAPEDEREETMEPKPSSNLRFQGALGMLPAHMRESIRIWIDEGWPHPSRMGNFLRALLSGDLFKAYAYADTENTDAMRTWVLFLINHAPGGCYGSAEKLLDWYEQHEAKRE